ncbi:esterase-like activity of phytase family protein [Halomonas sp. V046]|uniref:esterase-like activity of phytase family protein n=1 Tax=Halomonas sp. V046 TaxID=3459611 RepID=UPI004044361C
MAPPGIAFCGTLELPGEWPASSAAPGVPLGGLSALAWDADEGLLHLVSDRGRVHRARVIFDGKQLADLVVIDSHRLKGPDGHPLGGKNVDAESLVLDAADDGIAGNTRLLVGFEQDHRLQRFRPDGEPVGPTIRPAAAQDAGENQGMESLARLAGIGTIAGLEAPTADSPERITRLFTLDDNRRWNYPLSGAAGSALTDLAALDSAPPDGPPALLALERAYAPPRPLVISLSRVELLAPPAVRVTRLAALSSADGWRVDNMEGLTMLPDGRVLMVSDDNFSPLQRTLVSCLHLTDA